MVNARLESKQTRAKTESCSQIQPITDVFEIKLFQEMRGQINLLQLIIWIRFRLSDQLLDVGVISVI